MLLSGCAASKSAVFSEGDGRLAVALPIACEAFLQPVKVPPVTATTDARLAFTRTADALDDANDRLSAGGDCARDQRADYAAKETAK